MMSRAHRTPFSDWAYTIDRWLLAAIVLLIGRLICNVFGSGCVMSIVAGRHRKTPCVAALKELYHKHLEGV